MAKITFKDLLAKDPFELLEILTKEFTFSAPEAIETPDDMREAGRLLRDLNSAYSYLIQLQSYSKLVVRELKRTKADKDEIDKAIDRKEIISNFADVIKMNYNTISRRITIKQQINLELRMTDSR